MGVAACVFVQTKVIDLSTRSETRNYVSYDNSHCVKDAPFPLIGIRFVPRALERELSNFLPLFLSHLVQEIVQTIILSNFYPLKIGNDAY